MKRYIIIAVLALLTVSCEEDVVIYDNVNGQSFLKFENTAIGLPIPFTGSETVMVPISVSTISSSERTVSVSVVSEDSTLDPANYTFTQEVSIPANSYTGMLSIIGTNANIEIGVLETIVFKIDELSTGNSNASSTLLTVEAFLNCPYNPLDFVGSYTSNGSYEVQVTYDATTDLFRFINLRNAGGDTYVRFSYPNSVAVVDFVNDRLTNFGVLEINATFGNVFAVNLSGESLSTFRTCDQFIFLTFRRQIPDGRFFTALGSETLIKNL